MKKGRSWSKLTDNEWEMEQFAKKYSFQKGQEYAYLGRSSVTRALPDFAIGNDGVMFGNWIISVRCQTKVHNWNLN